MQVRGPGVAGGLLDENFSGLWEVVVVEEVGLITCERCVVGPRVRLLIRQSAQGILLRQHPHGRWSERSGGWSRRWERQVESAKRGSKRDQTHRCMKHGWYAAHKHLSQCRVTDKSKCAQTREKGDVWGVLFTHPVGCSRLPSTVNDLATTKKYLIMSSTSFRSTATLRYWKKKRANSDRSFIGAFLPDSFSEIYQFFLYLSYSSEDGQ